MQEIWKPIPGFDFHYEASTFGRIRRIHKQMGTHVGRVLKPAPHGDGYTMVNLCMNCIGHTRKIHQLVAITFIGAPRAKEEVNHRDGNRWNNHINNLEYVTRRENIRHSRDVLGASRGRKGSKNAAAKLNESQVIEIRRLHESGTTRRKLAISFGVSTVMIRYIVIRRCWKHI